MTCNVRLRQHAGAWAEAAPVLRKDGWFVVVEEAVEVIGEGVTAVEEEEKDGSRPPPLKRGSTPTYKDLHLEHSVLTHLGQGTVHAEKKPPAAFGQNTKDWNAPLPRIICFCNKCKETLTKAQLLWVVDRSCWCPRCFSENFQFHAASGLLVHKDTGYIPSIAEKNVHILMARTKMISSSATQMETLPSLVIFEEGTYCPVYANIYKFPNGNRTSAMLLTNGRFVSVGGVVLAVHEEEEPPTTGPMDPPHGASVKAPSHPEDARGGALAATKPCLDGHGPKDSEIQTHLKDSLYLSSTLELVNPARITVAQGLAASEDGDLLFPFDEDSKAI